MNELHFLSKMVKMLLKANKIIRIFLSCGGWLQTLSTWGRDLEQGTSNQKERLKLDQVFEQLFEDLRWKVLRSLSVKAWIFSVWHQQLKCFRFLSNSIFNEGRACLKWQVIWLFGKDLSVNWEKSFVCFKGEEIRHVDEKSVVLVLCFLALLCLFRQKCKKAVFFKSLGFFWVFCLLLLLFHFEEIRTFSVYI